MDFLDGDFNGTWIREVNKAFKAYFENDPPLKEFLDFVMSKK